MNEVDLERIKRNIAFIKEHFGSNLCGSTALSTDGPRVMAELQDALLLQDAQIKEYHVPGQHNNAWYQAKRLVAMLESKSV